MHLQSIQFNAQVMTSFIGKGHTSAEVIEVSAISHYDSDEKEDVRRALDSPECTYAEGMPFGAWRCDFRLNLTPEEMKELEAWEKKVCARFARELKERKL
jgi:hypothetical protein